MTKEHVQQAAYVFSCLSLCNLGQVTHAEVCQQREQVTGVTRTRKLADEPQRGYIYIPR